MKCRRRSRASLRHTGGPGDQAGFTVIEFVVAIALFVTIIVPVTQIMVSTMRVSGNLRSRVAAAYLAAQTVEQERSLSTTLSTYWGAAPRIVAPVTSTIYTITENIEWIGQGQPTSECTAGGGATGAELLQVTATVTWPNMAATAPVTSTADLAPPTGTISATTGAVGVQVVNAANQPGAGALITITNGTYTSSPIITGADGCAFFLLVPTTGSFTASATAAGQVSNQEATTATSQSFSVTAGNTIVVPTLQLDVGGTLLVASSAGPPVQATAGGLTLPYSAHYASLTPQPSETYAAGRTSLGPLFPFPGGYVPFAGTCTDSDPLGQSTTLTGFYTGASAPWALTAPWAAAIQPVAVVPPGTTPPATSVLLYPLSLAITNVNNRVITLMTATPTTGSVAGWPTLNWACPTSPAYTLAPPTAGSSITAIGLGHYTVQITTNKPATTTIYVWVEPDGTHLMSPTGTAATTVAPAPMVLP